MSNEENAKRAARFLRTIAAKIEEHPEFLADLDLADLPAPARKKKTTPVPPALDVLRIFFAEGAENLRHRLEALELKDLKAVISQHGLDPSGLAQKWRKQEKLIELIVQRVEARGRKGEVFRA